MPAAGSGLRFGGDRPKQYQLIDDRPVLWHALTRLARAPGLAGMAVGLGVDDPFFGALTDLPRDVVPFTGGAARPDTVLRGLAALSAAHDDDRVLVHDAVRPCLARADLDRLLAARGEAGALLATPLTDTLKREALGSSAETIPRAGLWRALTPQCFPVGLLRQALEQAAAAGLEATDEALAVEHLGLQPALITGRADNIKITFAEDLELAALILRRLAREGQ